MSSFLKHGKWKMNLTYNWKDPISCEANLNHTHDWKENLECSNTNEDGRTGDESSFREEAKSNDV